MKFVLRAILCILLIAPQYLFSQSIHQMEMEQYNKLTPDQLAKLRKNTITTPVSKSNTGCVLNKMVYGWLPSWEEANYTNFQWNLLSDLVYFGYEVNATTGGYNNIYNWETSPAVTNAKSNNVRISLCATLFSNHSTFLDNTTATNNFITTIVALVKNRGGHGINIDFENMTTAHKTSFKTFMIALANHLHSEIPGALLTVALPAVEWSDKFDVVALANYVDYWVIMGYDYYYKSSTTAGPTASIYSMTSSYIYNLSKSITYYRNKGVSNTKLLLGLPYYGYEYPTSSLTVPASASGTGVAIRFRQVMANSSGYYTDTYKKFNYNSYTPYYIYNTGGVNKQLFFDDKNSMEKKLDLILQRDLAGMGIWALGYDNGYTDYWDAIANKLSTCRVYPETDTLFDSGGPVYSYYDNDNYTFTLFQPNATTLNLNFLQFNVENSYDNVKVYDGTSTAATLLGTFTGTTLPAAITSTGNALTIKVSNSTSGTAAGWKAVYTSNLGTKQNQTITFAAIGTKAYGIPDFDPGATATSGLTVSYTSSNTSVATIVNNKIHIIGVGTTTIAASQSGNTTYYQAANINQTLTVSKANQTVTFNTIPAKTYGDPDFDAGATVSTGFALTYTSSNTAVATIVNNKIHIIAPGTTSITATQSGNTFYNSAQASQTLTVSKANQTITFNPIPDKNISTPDFSPGATATSGLTITYSSSNTAAVTIVSNQIHIVGYGTSTITAQQAGNSNYNAATNVTQTVTVTGKQNQTITFNAIAAKTYGDAPFTVSATASSALTVTYSSSNTAVATVSGNTVTIIGAGTTDIVASQAGNATYNPSESRQTLTVAKANQTLTITVTDKTYTDPDFTLIQNSPAGLAITYINASADIIELTGNTVHIKKPGEATIKAIQPGNSNYRATDTVIVSFTINKALAEIVIDESVFVYNGNSNGIRLHTVPSGLLYLLTYNDSADDPISAGTYSYKVEINDSLYSGTKTGTLTITKAGQTVYFGLPSVANFGDSPVTLTGYATSDLPIEYISDNVQIAEIVNNILTIKGAGTVTVSATQPGNANYNAAENVTRTMVINKAKQTISFDVIPQKNSNDAPFALVAVSSSGLPVNFTCSDANVATISGNLVTIKGAGSCVIKANQSGNTNYFAANEIAQPLTVILVTGINSAQNNRFKVYPVPATDYIFINGDFNNLPITAYAITDAYGKVVLQGSYNNGGRGINLSGLPNGMYFIKVYNGTQWSMVTKIIKL